MNASAVISYLLAREWAMDPKALRATADAITAALETLSPDALKAAQDMAAFRASHPTDSEGYRVHDGVAHIPIAGVILKEVPCIFQLMEMSATSTVDTQAAVEAALNDPKVTSISLDIDSPGGSLAGVQELADAIHAVRGLKPITAHVSDLSASAAYWLASQADSITANESAMIGSIGVYSVMQDSSGAYAALGVKVHVLRSHELKGAGVDGDVLTEAQIADGQRIIDQAADLFVEAVARGRGLDVATVKKMATGQVWFAGEAKDMRLIDGVTSANEAHKNATRSRQIGGPRMTTDAPRGALEITMTQEEMAAIAAENAALKAQMKGIAAQRREDVIAKHRDRIAPSALDSVKAYGEFCGEDIAKFEKFLQDMPAVTRATRESIMPSVEKITKTLQGIAAFVSPDGYGGQLGGDVGAKQVARWLQTSVEKMDRYAGVRGFLSNGTFVMGDGRNLTRDELNRELAAA